MPVAQLLDKDIDDLIAIPKYLPTEYRNKLRMRARPYSDKHEEGQFEIEDRTLGTFRVVLRKNRLNLLDFSAILCFIPQERIKIFRLRRYNGVHKHTNKMEQITFRTFHVHYASQRYQEAGWDIDAYAEPNEKYTTIGGALELLLDECSFVRPENERIQSKML